jgi:hypothetical protein
MGIMTHFSDSIHLNESFHQLTIDKSNHILTKSRFEPKS